MPVCHDSKMRQMPANRPAVFAFARHIGITQAVDQSQQAMMRRT